MKYYSVSADSYDKAVEKARKEYGGDVRIHSRRDYSVHGFLGIRKDRCEVVCYLPDKAEARSSGDGRSCDRDISEFEKEAMTPDPSRLSVSERLDSDFSRRGRDASSILDDRGILPPLKDDVLSSIKGGDDEYAVTRALSSLLRLSYSGIDRNRRFHVFLGPTGAGKTTTLAKVASSCSSNALAITLDGFRSGAYEQLQAFGNALGFSVMQACDSASFSSAISSHEDDVYIDTMGISPREKELDSRLGELLSLLDKDNAEFFFVIPSSMRKKDIEMHYSRYSRFPLSSIVITKLDESINCSDAVSFSYQEKLPISFLANGQRVPDDLEVASKRMVLEYIGLSFSDSRSGCQIPL